MQSLIDTFDKLPKVAKILLCLPVFDIVWSVYKLCRSILKNNVLGIVLAILTIIPGAGFIWIIDIITVIMNGKVWWID